MCALVLHLGEPAVKRDIYVHLLAETFRGLEEVTNLTF